MNKLFLGGTGTGKTYRFFQEYGNEKHLAIFPCRQLAYEVFLDYGKSVDASLHTGELHHEASNKSTIAVYESGYPVPMSSFDVLFVDELHYIADKDRGGLLAEFIELCISVGKTVIGATATDSIDEDFIERNNFERVNLKPFTSPPKKEEINEDTFIDNIVNKRMSSIIFTKYKDGKMWLESELKSKGISVARINANIKGSERLKTQLDFLSGKVQVVISTNVLAQGLNFPAQQVLIEYNEYDEDELIAQKIGRIGRPNKMAGDTAYYCCSYVPNKFSTKKVPKKVVRKASERWFLCGKIPEHFQEFEVPSSLTYTASRYSYKFLLQCRNICKADYLNTWDNIVYELEEEQQKMKNILLS